MKMSPVRSLILLIALAAPAIADEDGESKLPPLFTDSDIVEVTIRAPFGTIMKERSLEDEEQGQLIYEDPVAGETTLDIGIRARGRFRRQKDVCNFAPLRLNFRKTKGTLFAKSDKLKLVTHCERRNARYTQSVLREYLAYRILNTLTDVSFRVRLLRATYVDTEDGRTLETNYAFLIEHRDQLAKRVGMKVDESESTKVAALDSTHTNLVSVFQFLVGNTDFSPIKGAPGEPCCHNFVLLRAENGVQFSVPYDFDITGIVDAEHAVPNPRFRLRNVRHRLYRGRCVNNELLEGSLQTLREHRTEIYGLANDVPGMSSVSIRKTKGYLDDFYKVADTPKNVKRHLTDRCI